MKTIARTIVLSMLLTLLMSVGQVMAQEDMAQANKQTYLDVVAEYNAGNREALYGLLTEPFMMNQGDEVLMEASRADIEGYDQALVAAMPDLQLSSDVSLLRVIGLPCKPLIPGRSLNRLVLFHLGQNPSRRPTKSSPGRRLTSYTLMVKVWSVNYG